jgi:hypothetical protein
MGTAVCVLLVMKTSAVSERWRYSSSSSSSMLHYAIPAATMLSQRRMLCRMLQLS